MNYRSLSDMAMAIRKSLECLPKDIDLIVGIPRSGMLAAGIVALYRQLPMTDVDSFLDTSRIYNTGRRGRHLQDKSDINHILLIDDSISTGQSMSDALMLLCDVAKVKNILISTCSVFCSPSAIDMVDYHFDVVDLPRVFEWNIFHNQHLSNMCVDIDGILCPDPTKEENDDGDNYRLFIESTRSKIRPDHTVYALVSSRLEKYRKQTVEWLHNNNINFEKLYLLDGVSAEERASRSMHADYKAAIYVKTNAALFIESNIDQAKRIAVLSKMPVLCFENMVLYDKISDDDEYINSRSVFFFVYLRYQKLKRMYWRTFAWLSTVR